MIGAVLWRLWICFVRGADPSADLCHGIIVQLGTLGHFELFGKRLYLLQQRRKLPVLAFRGALSRFGIAKLATMLKKGVPDSSYVPVGNEKLLKRIEVDRKGGDGVARAQADHQQLAQADQRDDDEGARGAEGGEGPQLTRRSMSFRCLSMRSFPPAMCPLDRQPAGVVYACKQYLFAADRQVFVRSLL